MISFTDTVNSGQFPEELIPKGLALKRQWYLYEEISPFYSSPETANVTCPCTTQPKSTTVTVTSDKPSTSKNCNNKTEETRVKCKQTCSHCHQEGHTKTKEEKLLVQNCLC